ncbi:hypothetical protein TNCV_2282531 [Trichonephila clavipes]|nr:hypothetical protein TNCV_2282531 [Trichonephila clavipes]
MNEAAAEIHEKNNFDEVVQCGVSVDGTWQRRGHLSLNGCVSAISIDTVMIKIKKRKLSLQSFRNHISKKRPLSGRSYGGQSGLPARTKDQEGAWKKTSGGGGE